MPERAYTVSEIDALRQVVTTRYMCGSTYFSKFRSSFTSRAYKESDMYRAVEEQIRTYMTAGITANDIIEHDRVTGEENDRRQAELRSKDKMGPIPPNSFTVVGSVIGGSGNESSRRV